MSSVDTQNPGAIVLAGGLGERLGQDKATVTLGSETLVERAVRRILLWTEHVVVVGRPDQALSVSGIRVLVDRHPYEGVLAGILTGLAASECDWNLVIACDMPFVQIPVLDLLSDHRAECDVVVPHLAVGYEPLHALYHQRCIPAITASLEKGRKRVMSFYEDVRVCKVDEEVLVEVDPGLTSFVNINTPEDLAQIRQLVAGQ